MPKSPPQPLPEHLWGNQWRFVTFPAGDIEAVFGQRPMPIREIPDSLLPFKLGLASTLAIPGVVIYGARKSLMLARWLQENEPVYLEYIPTEIGKSGGLVLHAGEVDRWILVTFEDEEVAKAAKTYEQRKKASKGLHFLVVEPDDSGMTTTGFWLLSGEVK